VGTEPVSTGANNAATYDGAVGPNTPVIIGVGQMCERLGDEAYCGLSAVELAAHAAAESVADTAVSTGVVASAIDTVAAVRQFEISTPGAAAPLGRSDNYPRSVADRIGARPQSAIMEVSGGQSPQHLVTELAGDIAAGARQVALVIGAEAISTTRHFMGQTERPDFTDNRGGELDDRGFGLKGLISRYDIAHGLTDAPSQYGLLENARRAARGLSRTDYLISMGELFAPMSRRAAANPYAAAPRDYSVQELTTVTARNRVIADPYPRLMVARDQVNQGAGVLISSVAAATRMGVPREKWVYLLGHADLREVEILKRPDLSRSPAAITAVSQALSVAGVDLRDVSLIDLYSCFAIAVFNICDGLGISPTDPRGLTLTGGLPFFGGAGNNYSMHAIAEAVTMLRDERGAYAVVGANGGILSKYSVGVYSTRPLAWRENRCAQTQSALDAVPTVPYVIHADGEATIETYTVKNGPGGPTGVVVGRLENGRRFLATASPDDTEMLDLLRQGEPAGHCVAVTAHGAHNEVRLRRWPVLRSPRPAAPAGSDDRSTRVRRDGRVLEVTINRPGARNALAPGDSQELAEIFDDYFADPELWVAIITGAGSEVFCAGMDLRYAASGKPMWLPKTGFGGLTSRKEMTKPVIAAVNGCALGGGFEICLASHLVVADAHADFALSEPKVGLVAGAGGLVRLPRALPLNVAREMILTGRVMSAREAHHYGLVNYVTEPGQALTAAHRLAADIAAVSPTSTRISLQIMDETSVIADTVAAVDHPSELIDELLVSYDAGEGVAAFVAKRTPLWRNR
jgi:acetyl-CoA C-acetyltransferase